MQNKFAYILDTFRDAYEYSGQPGIDYIESSGNTVVIKNSAGDFFSEPRIVEGKNVVRKQYLGQQVPFLFDTDDGEPLISQKEGKVFINYDIIASAFYLLSGWQERQQGKRDQYDRFRYEDSIQHELDITGMPVVNYYFEILAEALSLAGHRKIVRKARSYDFLVCLTHDIDQCRTGWREDIFWAVKKMKPGAAAKIFLNRISGKDTWFNFDNILKLEQDLNVHSSFYFLPSGKAHHGIYNSDYKLENPRVLNVIRKVQASGSEAGIHGRCHTHDDAKEFLKDCTRFERRPVGNRYHYLLYDVGKTPAILEKAGMLYDSTVGFAEMPGYRNSYCFPYYLYDVVGDRKTNVLELPLTIMDTTLRKYLQLGEVDTLQLISQIIAEAKKFSGLITVLWHNTSFSEYKYAEWTSRFMKLIETFNQDKIFIGSGVEVITHFYPGLLQNLKK